MQTGINAVWMNPPNGEPVSRAPGRVTSEYFNRTQRRRKTYHLSVLTENMRLAAQFDVISETHG